MYLLYLKLIELLAFLNYIKNNKNVVKVTQFTIRVCNKYYFVSYWCKYKLKKITISLILCCLIVNSKFFYISFTWFIEKKTQNLVSCSWTLKVLPKMCKFCTSHSIIINNYAMQYSWNNKFTLRKPTFQIINLERYRFTELNININHFILFQIFIKKNLFIKDTVNEATFENKYNTFRVLIF